MRELVFIFILFFDNLILDRILLGFSLLLHSFSLLGRSICVVIIVLGFDLAFDRFRRSCC